MRQSQMVQPGDPAKNFSLKNQNDKPFDLYEQTGRRTLLSFLRLRGQSTAQPR